MSFRHSLIRFGVFALTAMMMNPAVAEDAPEGEACKIEGSVGIVAQGTDPMVTFRDFANMCAPVLWFSPDEPNLLGAKGKDILLPLAFPFEGVAETPVVYYRIRTLLVRADMDSDAIVTEDIDRIDTMVDFRQIAGVDLDFFFYYPSEEGLGAHTHDVEAVYMKTFIQRCENCAETHYALVVDRTIAKAHGILWYDNTLVTDKYTEFPMTILVEEGKHASCTDKNQDGVYTPTFDVNKRVNDAWGIRDIMRSGGLYSGGYQGWMSKSRTPEYRIFPPFLPNLPVHQRYVVDGVYAPDNAQYELRPFPRSENAADDPHLVPFIADKGDEDWPEVVPDTDLTSFTRWMDEDKFINSFTLALRLEGQNYGSQKQHRGPVRVFPLLVVKNVADPVGRRLVREPGLLQGQEPEGYRLEHPVHLQRLPLVRRVLLLRLGVGQGRRKRPPHRPGDRNGHQAAVQHERHPPAVPHRPGHRFLGHPLRGQEQGVLQLGKHRLRHGIRGRVLLEIGFLVRMRIFWGHSGCRGAGGWPLPFCPYLRRR